MARVTRAAAHLSAEEVKKRLKHDPRPWCRERWLIIYNALVDPRPAEEIAIHCGVSTTTVHHVIVARAEHGEIATVAEVQQAFEAQIGQEVDDSTIYRLLHRHGWRKLMPRPRHPQASQEAQEQFKKTLPPKSKPPSPAVR